MRKNQTENNVMDVENVKRVLYELTADFFKGATVIWAEQINTKPEPPYITIKTGNIDKTVFPVIDDDGATSYPCSTKFEINLYTKGRPIKVGKSTTGNFVNTAANDLMQFFVYLESEAVVDKLSLAEIDMLLNPPVRDLTILQNDSRYRYRAMAEATVSFMLDANGAYGISGANIPNPSGGGTEEMSGKNIEPIKEVTIQSERGK